MAYNLDYLVKTTKVNVPVELEEEIREIIYNRMDSLDVLKSAHEALSLYKPFKTMSALAVDKDTAPTIYRKYLKLLTVAIGSDSRNAYKNMIVASMTSKYISQLDAELLAPHLVSLVSGGNLLPGGEKHVKEVFCRTLNATRSRK